MLSWKSNHGIKRWLTSKLGIQYVEIATMKLPKRIRNIALVYNAMGNRWISA